MSRRLIAWLLTLPLAVAGTQVAHWLAYRVVTPTEGERAHELTATGHGYFQYVPLALAVAAVLVGYALVAEARHVVAKPTDSGARPRGWHFALVAPAIFLFQEHFERLLHDGSLPWSTLLAASVLTGLALQLPFAIAAYAVAHLLLRVARSLGCLLARPQPRSRLVATIARPPTRFDAPRLPALALGYGSRGPPSTSL